MIKIDNKLLEDAGLGDLPEEEKKTLLAHLYEQLEMNVGKTLASQMSDEQLNEFESFVDGNDEEGALKWLEANFPDYRDVVAQELEKLVKELKENADKLLSADEPSNE